MRDSPSKGNKERAFVDWLFKMKEQDKALRAAFRYADNPNTAYQSWPFLVGWNIDIEKPFIYYPYITIAASIAKNPSIENGKFGLGETLAKVAKKEGQEELNDARLKRLLSCDTGEDVCKVIKPILSLIVSKDPKLLDYAAILSELKYFDLNPLRTKTKWAVEFYPKKYADKNEESHS